MSPQKRKKTHPAAAEEKNSAGLEPAGDEVAATLPVPALTAAAAPDDIQAVWLPSPDANVEIRWQIVKVVAEQRPSFRVQVLAITHLISLPAASRGHLRGLVLTPHLPETRRRMAELVVQTTLSPGKTETPFSLHSSSDPRPLFRGVLAAEYPEEGEGRARLLVRDLVYTGGHIAEKVLDPALAAGLAPADE